jgi:hypothetical protein
MIKIKFGKDKYHLVVEMNKWLKENIGHGGWQPMLDAKWHVESAYGTTWYVFKDESDAMLFLLRWS